MSLKTNLFRFIFISVLGVLLHFTYEWSGDNAVVGLFSAVNESTWEHLKLVFFPYLSVLFVERLFLKDRYPRYFTAHLAGLLAGLGAIPVLFYTYTGILGTNCLAADIAVFLAAAALAWYLSYRLLCASSFQRKGTETGQWSAVIAMAVLLLFFAYATFFPPDIPLFLPPS